MPGTPATSPYYGAPRYDNTDPADFSTDVNAITDLLDAALGVRRQDIVTAAADVAVAAGQMAVVSGAHNVTLPTAPRDQASVTVLALSGDCTATPGGSDTITHWSTTGLTSLTVKGKTIIVFRYHAGVWYAASPTQQAGGDASGTLDNLALATWGGQTKVQVVGGNPPQAHAASHASGGTDYVPGLAPVGACIPWTGTGDPPEGEWVIADGRLIDRTTYANFYARTGHVYNGGVDPGNNQVRIPDKRGKGSAGALNMGSAAGAAASDNSHMNLTRGQKSGEVNHVLLGGELATHAHGVSDPTHAHNVYDPGHAHGVSDPTHYHGFARYLCSSPYGFGGQQASGAWLTEDGMIAPNEIVAYVGVTTPSDIGVTSATTYSGAGIGVAAAGTGIGIYGGYTGVSIQNAGSNAAHNNVSPNEADSYIVRIA